MTPVTLIKMDPDASRSASSVRRKVRQRPWLPVTRKKHRRERIIQEGDDKESPVELFRTRQGKNLIILNGHVYNLQRKEKQKPGSPKILWRCNKKDCVGKAETDTAYLTGRMYDSHNHAKPSLLDLERIRLRHYVHEITRTLPIEESCGQILDLVLDKISPELRPKITKESIRHLIIRVKEKMMDEINEKQEYQ